MISGIGCDIVEHSKTVQLGWLTDINLLKRVFSENEIASAPELEIEKYYSSRFAIKEAVFKCLGTGMEDGISLKEIDTRKTDDGALKVILNGKVKKIADQKAITTWHISLSHSSNCSIAFVIAENRNERL